MNTPEGEAGGRSRRGRWVLALAGLLPAAAPFLAPARPWLLAAAGLVALLFAGSRRALPATARAAGLLAGALAPLAILGLLPAAGPSLLLFLAALLSPAGRGSRVPRPGPGVLLGGLGMALFTIAAASGLAAGPRVEALTVSLLLGSLLGAPTAGWQRLRSFGGPLGSRQAALLPLACATVIPALFAPAPPARAAARGDRPDIVFVTLDTTRADRWEAVRVADRALRPDVEPLEAGSVLFTAATATAALTAPAHASLLTGLHPHRHGVFNNGGVLEASETLPAILRRAGYRTLAAPSVVHLDPAFGFGEGFDAFASVEGGLGSILRRWRGVPWADLLRRLFPARLAVRRGEATLAEARRLWRQAAGSEPRFLWVHLFDPHWPFEPPERILAEIPEGGLDWPNTPTPGFAEAEVRAWRRAYDAEILATRRLLETFLADLSDGDSGRPLWVIGTADHGDALGDHGSVDHGDLLYQEQVHVPLWVRIPGLAGDAATLGAVREVKTPVSHVDLLPSLAELLGLELPAGLPGRSWAPALRGRPLPPVAVFASTHHAAFENHMVRLGRWKRIVQVHKVPSVMRNKPGRRPRALDPDLPWIRLDLETYDLERDPLELQPLSEAAAQGFPEASGALAALRAFEQECDLSAVPRSSGQGPDRDVMQLLEGLGYAGSGE